MNDDDPTFRELLEDELLSTVMPQRDPLVSSSDELVRDIHKLLAGNGSIAKGLVFKLASTTAQVKLLERSYGALCANVKSTSDSLSRHLESATPAPRPAAVPQSLAAFERMALGSLVLAIWKYRVVLGLGILALVAVINNRDISDTQRQISVDSAAIRRALYVITTSVDGIATTESKDLRHALPHNRARN